MQLVTSPPEEWRRRCWQDGCEVTSVDELVRQAAGSPSYFSCSNWEDLTHPNFYMRQVAYLRQAYRSKARVSFVSQSTSTACVDIFVDEGSHFGANRLADPLAGLDCARWEQRNYTPFRHARMDKLCLMDQPFASGEILLDLPRDASFLERAAVHYQLILDRDGRVATPLPGQDYQAIPNSFFGDYAIFSSYNRRGGDSYWLALMHEQLLRALISDQGRFFSGTPIGPGTWDRVVVLPRTMCSSSDRWTATGG